MSISGGWHAPESRHTFTEERRCDRPTITTWIRHYCEAYDCSGDPITVRVVPMRAGRGGRLYPRRATEFTVFAPAAPALPTDPLKALGWSPEFMEVLQRAAAHAFGEIGMVFGNNPGGAGGMAAALGQLLHSNCYEPLEQVYMRLGELESSNATLVEFSAALTRRLMAPRYLMTWSVTIPGGATRSLWEGCPWVQNPNTIDVRAYQGQAATGRVPLAVLLRLSTQPGVAAGTVQYSTSVAPPSAGATGAGLLDVPAFPDVVSLGEPGAEFGVPAPVYLFNPGGAAAIAQVAALYIPPPDMAPTL